MSVKKEIDWGTVEAEYRAGAKSLAVLAKERGISKGRICQVAKREGWVRDLSAKVNAKVKQALNADELNAQLNEKAATEREVVEATAATHVRVVREHRKDIGLLRDTLERLMGQVASLVENREGLDGVMEDLKMASPDDVVRLIVTLGKRLHDIPNHAQVLKELGNTLKTVIALEREAFNIMGAAEPPPPAAAVADSAAMKELSARLEALGG